MQKILVLSGKKQSGKTSGNNFIHGYVLREIGVFEDFGVHHGTGDLVVPTAERNAGGTFDKTKGFFSFGEDRVLTEPYYVEWAQTHVWPYIKRYSFADTLKRQAIELFNLTVDQCYGSDEDKNSPTTVKWKYVSRVLGVTKTRKVMKELGLPYRKNEGDVLESFMTVRQFLQVYGTDICRAINPDCWLDATIGRVLEEKVPISIIDDGRFPNEIDKVYALEDKYNVEVKSIRFLRKLFDDDHASETALDNYDKIDLFVPPECGLIEKHELMLGSLREWGWV